MITITTVQCPSIAEGEVGYECALLFFLSSNFGSNTVYIKYFGPKYQFCLIIYHNKFYSTYLLEFT